MVVLSTSALPDIRMTVDEYLSADLPEGTRYELVDGVIEMSPVPGMFHEIVVARLRDLLIDWQKQHPNVIGLVATRPSVTLPQRPTAREPDLCTYSPADVAGAPTGKSWKEATPMLVVEVVSFGQEDRDYDEKRRDYWDAGVPEYWIVDPQRRALTALTRAAGAWNEEVFDERAVFRPKAFPGLEIKLANLFA